MFPSHRINIKSEKIKWNVDVSVLRIASRNVSPSTSPPHKQTLETPEWRHHISQVFILLGCPQPGAFLSSAAEQCCKVQCVYAISISQYELEQKQKFWGWGAPLGSASLRQWREFAERIYFNWRTTDTRRCGGTWMADLILVNIWMQAATDWHWRLLCGNSGNVTLGINKQTFLRIQIWHWRLCRL